MIYTFYVANAKCTALIRFKFYKVLLELEAAYAHAVFGVFAYARIFAPHAEYKLQIVS